MKIQHTSLFLFTLLLPTSLSLSEDDPYYTNCSTRPSCGTIRDIGYPFWGTGRPEYCGQQGLELRCNEDVDGNYPVMRMGTLEYSVLDINTDTLPIIRMARTDLWEGVCLEDLTDTSLDYTIFSNSASTRNLSIFYNCSRSNYSVPYNFSCGPQVGYYADESLLRIKLPPSEYMACTGGISVPILTRALDELADEKIKLEEALNGGFELIYNPERRKCSVCESTGGECGSDLSSSDFLCLCSHGHYPDHCPAVSAIGVVLIIISAFLIWRKYSHGNSSLMFWKRKPENIKNIELFLENFGSLHPNRFSYSDIKKITNSFKDKLGEGGFGGVYRGKLQDGRLVAVKVLNSLKGSGEDFINEVSSISKTSHINVVTLLGFCFEGRKRALVYEFMPNGSLEKFIYQNNPVTSERQLKWETLYQIAVGIARGLEYLHRGCNTRILHFDIKPHNILLNEEFIPKISDFGLAKICPEKESIVSMLGARGTPGYIAPEVFSRNFGGVSHKSDVYSYGMMVLEMVGGRRNIDCGADRTSELYFPQWIYKRLELRQELGLQGIVEEDEKEKARKMIIVSMWCIQTDPSNRPPMNKVVEMLEGGLDSLQIPPQPFLSSPSRSPAADSPILEGSSSSLI